MANNQELRQHAAAVKVGGQRHFMSRKPKSASAAPHNEIPEPTELPTVDDYPRPTHDHEQHQEHPRHDEVPKKLKQERRFEGQPRWTAKHSVNSMPRNAGTIAMGGRIAQPSGRGMAL
ncbi:hypothetical protein HDZ31DRAFT_59544 [Schizophyllum fasciatum]